MATISYSWAVKTNPFLMNDLVTAGNQSRPAIAANANGGYFGAWDHPLDTGSVRGRAVDDAGAPIGTDFLVNTTSTNNQFDPSIASLSNGNYIVSFTDTSTNPDGQIRYRMFNASGAPLAADVPAVGSAFGDAASDVAALSDGGFVIAFQRDFGGGDFDINFRRFDANGVSMGLSAAEAGSFSAKAPSVTGLTGGGFVVAWEQSVIGNASTSVQFQRVDAAGAAAGSRVQIDAAGSINSDIQIQGLADGGFAVAYTDNGWGISGTEITVRVFNADGTTRSSFIRANTETTGNQDRPSLTALSNGFFVVAWSDGNNLIQQAYDANGVAAGANHTIVSSAIEGEIAALSGGLVANVRSSFLADAGGDNSIRSNITQLSRTTTGDGTDEVLAGDSIRDLVDGGGGSDFIAGGGGGDQMSGGLGFDAVSWFGREVGLVVNLTNQTLNDGAAAGDSVSSFEAYYLTNSADSFTNAGAGGYIYGFGGGDIIIGGAGSEFIEGGLGGDQINGAGGFDYASYANATSGVRLDFTNAATNTGEAAGDAITNVEAFYLSAHADIFIGQTGQNIVFAGNGGDALFGGVNASDWLFGEGGADFLSGGNFDDLLSGGAGADTYAFASWVGNGLDSILDFTSGQDKFQLTGSGFGLLAGTPIVNGVNFIAAASPFATSAQGTLLYATGLGILYYDPDGSGAGAAIALAQITGAPLVTAGDFVVA